MKVDINRRDAMCEDLSGIVMGRLAHSSHGFQDDCHWFANCMKVDINRRDEPEAGEINDIVGDWNDFPLAKYLITNMHLNMAKLFEFGYHIWVLVMLTFVIFAFCHRLLFMGYIRIMIFFTLISILSVVCMGWFTQAIAQKTARLEASEKEAEQVVTESADSMHTKYHTEAVVLRAMKFALFFQCYGVARMALQGWMWTLHFWPVLCLTIVALVLAVCFVIFVAPAIPNFCLAMAMPPYINHVNLKIMLHTLQKKREEEEDARKPTFATA